MKFSINPGIFKNFNNVRVAVTVVRNVDNNKRLDFSNEFKELKKEIELAYGTQVISEIPQIASWRDAYRAFGVKAKDYPSSIEALLKRVAKGGDFWGINPLVDIYNYVSLKHLLPAGGEDTDKINGDLELTFASANEVPVVVLGKDKEESPKEGEVIYKDAEGTICRRWNWREAARTVLDEKTNNCILVFEALDPVTDEELEEAQKELSNLLKKHLNAEVTDYILDENNSLIEF